MVTNVFWASVRMAIWGERQFSTPAAMVIRSLCHVEEHTFGVPYVAYSRVPASGALPTSRCGGNEMRFCGTPADEARSWPSSSQFDQRRRQRSLACKRSFPIGYAIQLSCLRSPRITPNGHPFQRCRRGSTSMRRRCRPLREPPAGRLPYSCPQM